MKKFMAVFTTSFKYLWRDKIGIAVLMIFPVVLILVLGAALSQYISPETSFDPVPIAAVAEEGSGLNTFLQNEEISNFLDITFTDSEQALTLLEDGEAAIIVSEENGKITVTRPIVTGLKTQIAAGIIDSYTQIGAAMTIAMINGGDFAALSEIIGAEISVTDAPLGNRVPNATDYYAVTMLVMILMFAGMNGMELFKKSILSETGARMLITPVSKPTLVGGLLAASTLTTYIQGLFTFVFSYLVYGVYWGDRIPLVLLTLFGVTLFSQAFAIFLLLLFKSANATMGAMQALIWMMTFVSGGYTKVDFGAAQQVFQYAPNSLAHTVIFGAAFGGNEAKMMSSLALIFVYGAVLFILAFIVGKRRLA